MTLPHDLTTIPDLAGAPKRVFVTSTLYNGNLGGLAGADSKCQARAAAVGLPGTYKAWLSSTTVPVGSRLTHSMVPYVLVTGSVIAADWGALTSGGPDSSSVLSHAIDITELGTTPTAMSTSACGTDAVWTDSREDGTLFNGGETCGDWTDPIGVVSGWGNWRLQANWSLDCNGGNSATIGCASLSPLYCFEQ
jgi:hypothetical protein